jgi:hypothetical protein
VKKSLILMLASLIALSLAAGCKDKTKAPETAETKAPAAEQTAQGQSGTVTETMNSGGYTRSIPAAKKSGPPPLNSRSRSATPSSSPPECR